MTRPRTKTITINGAEMRIQKALPIHCGYFGAVCEEADFTQYDGEWHVEAMVKLGIIEHAYTLVLTIAQALEADIVEIGTSESK